MVSEQFLPAIPVFGIGIDRFNDAYNPHGGRRLVVAAGGGDDLEGFPDWDVQEFQAGGVHGDFNDDVVGIAGGVIVAGVVGQSRPAAGNQPGLIR